MGTRRADSPYGSSSRRTPWTTANMAVAAAIPSASVSDALAVNDGARLRQRSAYWRSPLIGVAIGSRVTLQPRAESRKQLFEGERLNPPRVRRRSAGPQVANQMT